MALKTITSGVMIGGDVQSGSFVGGIVTVANFGTSAQEVSVFAYYWGSVAMLNTKQGGISSPTSVKVTPATATVDPGACFAFVVESWSVAIGTPPQYYPALCEIRVELEEDADLVVTSCGIDILNTQWTTI
jgi:hypothetical protein